MIAQVLTTNGAGAVAFQEKAFKVHHAANDQDSAPAFHRTALSLVRGDGADLTARQLGIFLSLYLDEGPRTVRRPAALFGICKSAVTRAVDRLGGLGLARRQVDPRDRCSVLVHRTEFGWAFLGELRRAMDQVAKDAERAASPRPVGRPWPRAVPVRRTGRGHGFAVRSPSD